MMSLLEYIHDWSDRRLVTRNRRQRILAMHSRLNWRHETQNLIEDEAIWFAVKFAESCRIKCTQRSIEAVQLDCHTDELLPREIGAKEFVQEEPARLVYSLHPNGSIVVLGYPHASAYAGGGKRKMGEREPLVLDVLAHACDLAGASGRATVRKHLRTLVRLSVLTRTHALPNPASGRFLARLEERAERFAVAFPSRGEARRHRLSQEANLSIGLIVCVR